MIVLRRALWVLVCLACSPFIAVMTLGVLIEWVNSGEWRSEFYEAVMPIKWPLYLERKR